MGYDKKHRVKMAWGYGRVSTDEQANGLEAQRVQVEGYYQYLLKPQNIGWAGWHQDEGVSGNVPFKDRDVGFKVATSLEAGDHLVVAKLDRAFRSAIDCLRMTDQCKRRGIVLHFLDLNVNTQSPLGELVIGIMALFAQWERRRIGERIRDVNAVRKAKGLACGLAPYGYTLTKAKRVPGQQRIIEPSKLNINLYEWKVMKRCYEMVNNGEPLSLIAEKFKAAGVVNRKGNPWDLASIHRMGKRYATALSEGKVPPELSADCT